MVATEIKKRVSPLLDTTIYLTGVLRSVELSQVRSTRFAIPEAKMSFSYNYVVEF